MSNTLFIGRWSPFHDGHKYIIDSYVNNGKPVVIGVRDTPLSIKDPFPAELRKKRIEKIYETNNNVQVIIIPDIETDVGDSVATAVKKIQDIL